MEPSDLSGRSVAFLILGGDAEQDGRLRCRVQTGFGKHVRLDEARGLEAAIDLKKRILLAVAG